MKFTRFYTVLSPNIFIFLALSVLLVTTRPYHFASALHLPSASLAVFFLAGLFTKRLRYFYSLFALSVFIDLISSYARGELGSCITPSYPFLIVGYYALFATGQYITLTQRSGNSKEQPILLNPAVSTLKVMLGLWLASSFSFFTSNASYYFLSGQFSDLSTLQYVDRVTQYYLPYVQSPFIYVVASVAYYFTYRTIQQKKSPRLHNKVK